MKKLLTFIVMAMLGLFIPNEIYAQDIIPTRVNLNQPNSIGMYQVGDDVTIYAEPEEDAQILYRVRWNNDEFFPAEIGEENFFTVFLPKKSLALVSVVDMTDDWIEIIYDNKKNLTGWIKLDDPYKFMTWINFYNTYGKKYGLVMLKSAPETCKDIKSSTEDSSQTISTINYPIRINLNVIRGNWALVSVLDYDKTPKTGYIRWRSNDGIRYFFPNLK